jgi:glycine cleavage system aminomethyltransferase T
MCDHDGWLINDPVLLPLSETCVWLSIADSDIALWAAADGARAGSRRARERTRCLAARHPGTEGDGRRASLMGDWVRALKYFQFRETELDGIPLIVARSGWSKQGGVELYLRDGTRGSELWSA